MPRFHVANEITPTLVKLGADLINTNELRTVCETDYCGFILILLKLL